MNQQIIFKELGTMAYAEAYEYQLKLFNETIEKKKKGEPTENRLLFVEHPHVYTLGKSGDYANLMIPESFLQKINATFFKTDRGGDITYHGYGQIVIYPIFDLDNFGILIKKYIQAIEEAIIRTLKEFGLEGKRINGAAGIWLTDRPRFEKICALGVRVSRAVTMHGLAFNVNTNLDYFNHINPCGFTDKGVTSLQKELGKEINVDEVKELLKKYYSEVFEELK
ncbi:MAG: lipoyl(octanoyl) transferase LipB [Bacteroidales bacterium]|nr:lipoyl(octanoyl) transferase LipB [Bacteroidales bacterium]